MVERQLRRRGIDDERVLAAMAAVPREHFVPERRARAAPTTTRRCRSATSRRSPSPGWSRRSARRCELDGDERVLEIGTGSGYSAAVLARLAGEVISVERLPELGRGGAARELDELGIGNVEVIVGDGSRGYPSARRSTRSRSTPRHRRRPHSLLAQLRRGGRLVVPIATGSRRPAHRLLAARRPRARDDRALPVRAADRRRGLQAAETHR